MPDVPETLRAEEYRALRDTIRQRGSLRVALAVVTFSVWAGAILLERSHFDLPFYSLVPLVVLAAGFEAVFALHTGVERIGRYIQAHHEPASNGQARWEEAAMGFRGPGGGANPLFPAIFLGAALVNLTLGVFFGLEENGEFREVSLWVPVLLLHLGFLARVILAARFAAGQRNRDLEEFLRVLKR